MVRVYRGRGATVHVNIGLNSLSPHVVDHCNGAPGKLITSYVRFLRLYRDRGFRGVMLSIGTSGAVDVVRTIQLLATRVRGQKVHCPLRLNMARTNDSSRKHVGSTVNVNALLKRKVNSAVHISLSRLPRTRVPITRGVISCVAGHGRAAPVRNSPTPCFSHCRFHHHGDYTMSHTNGGRPIVIMTSGLPSGNLRPSCAVSALPTCVAISTGSLASDAVTSLGSACGGVVLVGASRSGHPSSLTTTVRHVASTKIALPMVTSISCDLDSVRALRVRTTYSLKPLLVSKLVSNVCVHGGGPTVAARRVPSLTFGVLRSSHTHVARARCVSYPDYKHAGFSLPHIIRRMGRTASGCIKLGVTIVNYVIGNPNRVTSTSFNCVNTKRSGISLFGNGRYVGGGVPTRATVTRLVRLVRRRVWGHPAIGLLGVLSHFVPKCHHCMITGLLLGLYTAVFGLFSFTSVVPVLRVLFNLGARRRAVVP